MNIVKEEFGRTVDKKVAFEVNLMHIYLTVNLNG